MNKTPDFVACEDCALDPICHPLPGEAYSTAEPSLSTCLENYVLGNMERRRAVSAGKAVYQQGEPVTAIYAVTSGAFKLLKQSQQGHQQLSGFRFQGELLGDEALAVASHPLSAIALSDASVCVIPLDIIQNISKAVPEFQQIFLRLIIQQCYLAHQELSDYVALNSAEQKLAGFLLHLSKRNTCKKDHPDCIFLQMSRTDIASYLGLRHETLSRTLGKLQKYGLIQSKGKQIQLLNRTRLATLVSGINISE